MNILVPAYRKLVLVHYDYISGHVVPRDSISDLHIPFNTNGRGWAGVPSGTAQDASDVRCAVRDGSG